MTRTIAMVLACLGCATVSAQDLQSALELTRELVEEHRYRDIIDVLTPFDDLEDPESRYAVAAELGRAYFHLGDYPAADAAFRQAVKLRPERVETALYLEATSYQTGNRELAYAIFREIIVGGATDLYLAVTLPGERLFLADPEVWSILDELAREVPVDVDAGSLLGVELGQQQAEVERRLGATAATPGATLTARAGPYLTWAFGFDDAGALVRIVLHNEHLIRYTPYRLRLIGELDWRATPADATSVLGPPASTTATEHGLVVMVWNRHSTTLILEFAPPQPPAPPAFDRPEPGLRLVRIEAVAADGAP